MNNYCRSCGFKLEPGMKICSKCNAEIFEERINVESKQKELKELKKKEDKYIIAIFSLFGLSYLLSNFLKYKWVDEVVPILWFLDIMMLVYARITINQSKKIKVMFNIVITLLIIYLFWMALLIITCGNMIKYGCGF